MNLENICQVKEASHKMSNIVSFYLYEICTRIAKFIETESGLDLLRGWLDGEMRNYCLTYLEFLFGMMKKFGKGGNYCIPL